MAIPYLVFGTVGVLALVSLVFGTINIVSLARISGKLNSLDEELEKKASELDALRKKGIVASERPASPSEPPADTAKTEEEGEDSTSHLDTSQIQIVRNVRGTFDGSREPRLEDNIVEVGAEKAEQPSRDTERDGAPAPPGESAGAEAPSATPPEPPSRPHTIEDETTRPSPGPEPDQAPQWTGTREGALSQPEPDECSVQPQPRQTKSPEPVEAEPVREQLAGEQEDDILDVVSDQEPEHPTDTSVPTIMVYSPHKKDADFERVSRELRQKWPPETPGRLVLDFSDVIFLYPRELSYLEQMETYARGHDVELSFAHCDTELRAILSQHPSLGQHIED